MSQGPHSEDNYMKTRDSESKVSNPPGREELNETIENRVPVLTFNLQGRQAILPRALCSEPDMIIWAFVGQMISATDTQVLNVSKIRAEGHGYGPTKGILDQDFFSPSLPRLGMGQRASSFPNKRAAGEPCTCFSETRTRGWMQRCAHPCVWYLQ